MKLTKINTNKINLIKNMFESDFLIRYDKYANEFNPRETNSSLVNNKNFTLCNVEQALSEIKQLGSILGNLREVGDARIYLIAESPFVYEMLSHIFKTRLYTGLSKFWVVPNLVQSEKQIISNGGNGALIFFGACSSASVRAARRIALKHAFLFVDVGESTLERGISNYKVSIKIQSFRQIVFLCSYIAYVLDASISKK